jgi:hypothetical protein
VALLALVAGQVDADVPTVHQLEHASLNTHQASAHGMWVTCRRHTAVCLVQLALTNGVCQMQTIHTAKPVIFFRNYIN